MARHSLSHRRCLCLDALRLQLAKMMDDDDDDDGTCKLVPAHYEPCPTTPDAASRPTTALSVPMAGALLSTASSASIYGATVHTRPRPALLPSRTTRYPPPTSRTTARNPYRSVSTCSYRLSLTKPPAQIASRTRHPPGKAMR